MTGSGIIGRIILAVDEFVEAFDVLLEVAVFAAHEDLAGVVVVGPGLISGFGVAHGDAELLDQGVGRAQLIGNAAAEHLQDQIEDGIDVHVGVHVFDGRAGQIENILDANDKVQMSCVIGVPDPYRMQKVKAFVKLAADVPANDATKAELMDYCRKHIAKYAMPYDIEFKDDMPKTLVGKVAYRVLEEEELAKRKAAEQQ